MNVCEKGRMRGTQEEIRKELGSGREKSGTRKERGKGKGSQEGMKK